MKGLITSSERTFFSDTKLTWIQSLICKWFKITPLLLHFHRFKVKGQLDCVVRNDIVITGDNNAWYVDVRTENGEIIVEFICLYAIQEVKKLFGDFYVLSRCNGEFDKITTITK